jgi:hypothetical protein
MFRRGTSILVMLGYLAGQSAAIPHAHVGGSQHDHDACAPHIHLSWFGGQHHHEHQDRDNFAVVPDLEHLEFNVGFGKDGAEDHDDDAVYIPSGLTAGATSVEYPTGSPEWQVPTALHSCVAVIGLSFDVTFFGPHLRPPDSTGQGCALFLRLLTLRI